MELQGLRGINAALLLATFGNCCVTASEPVPEQIKNVADFKMESGGADAIAFSPDGKTLAATNADGTVQLWNLINRKVKTILIAPNRGEFRPTAISMAFSSNGKVLASSAVDRQIRFWDTFTGKYIGAVKSKERLIGIVLSSDGKTIAVSERDGVRIWDVEKKKERSFRVGWAIPVTTHPSAKRPLMAVNHPRNGSFRLVDAMTGDSVLTCAGHKGGNSGRFAIDQDDKMVVSLGGDGTVRLWNRVSGENTATIAFPSGLSANSLALSPDGKIVALSVLRVRRSNSEFHNGILLYAIPSGKLLESQVLSGMHRLAFSPDGSLLATATGDTVKLWSIPAAWRKAKK